MIQENCCLKSITKWLFPFHTLQTRRLWLQGPRRTCPGGVLGPMLITSPVPSFARRVSQDWNASPRHAESTRQSRRQPIIPHRLSPIHGHALCSVVLMLSQSRMQTFLLATTLGSRNVESKLGWTLSPELDKKSIFNRRRPFAETDIQESVHFWPRDFLVLIPRTLKDHLRALLSVCP